MPYVGRSGVYPSVPFLARVYGVRKNMELGMAKTDLKVRPPASEKTDVVFMGGRLNEQMGVDASDRRIREARYSKDEHLEIWKGVWMEQPLELADDVLDFVVCEFSVGAERKMGEMGEISKGRPAMRIEARGEDMGCLAEYLVAPVDWTRTAVVEKHDVLRLDSIFSQPKGVCRQVARRDGKTPDARKHGADSGQCILDGGQALWKHKSKRGRVVRRQHPRRIVALVLQSVEGRGRGRHDARDPEIGDGLYEDMAIEDGKNEDIDVARHEAQRAGCGGVGVGDEREDEVLELDGESGPEGH